MATTASELTRLLEHYDVSHVFGIPGVHTLELYRALADTALQHVTPRHEQGAGFAADGYARVSGKPGVCFIISGPGMTNIITAMGQAYSESIPMLVISSVNSHGRMGSGDGWLHELPDQRALVHGVCAFSHTLQHPDELPQVLARAFAVFDSQRPRPVHLEIPMNVLQAECQAVPVADSGILRLDKPAANARGLAQAAKLLADAQSPVLIVGGGAKHVDTCIGALAERLDAPVVMSVNARGVLAYDHPLAVSASASLPAVRELLAAADVVLGIGTEMGPTDYDFNEDGEFEIPGTFIRIDIDAQQLVRNTAPSLGLVGDAKSACQTLLQALNKSPAEKRQFEDGQQAQRIAGEARARSAMQGTTSSLGARDRCYLDTLASIRNTLEDVVIVGDSTQLIYAGNCAFGMPRPACWFNSAMGFGTLGYALPAAIGVAVADRQRTVVAISGDGGLQFCLAELATAVDEKLQLILIVHENGGYEEISKSMQSKAINPVGVDLLVPDLSAIALACGWQCQTLSALGELPDKLLAAKESQIPTMLVVPDSLFEAEVK